jgi:hypothetical protein
MKTVRIIVMLFAAMFLPFIADSTEDRTIKRTKPDQTSAPEQRLALIIGNSAYKSSPLKNTINDANDMEKALRNMGFQVMSRINASRRDMIEIISEFGKRLKHNDVGLFYFSGHGIQYNGENFLVPTDANIQKESDLEFESVHARRVLSEMSDAGNRLNIVILDACRNNPFPRSFRAVREGLAQMNATRGMLIAYSTSPDSVASDGSGRNGTYTENLLKYMTSPGLKVEEVFKKVRIGVMTETSDKQVPWESSSLTGDFYFASSGAVVDAPAISPTKATLSVESNISGAKVLIDGKDVGITPIKDMPVSVGEYRLTVEKDGYESYQKQVRIETGRAINLYVDLKQKKSDDSASVQLPSASEEPKYSTGKQPMAFSESDLRLSKDGRPTEYTNNQFQNNGNRTISDRATGLMWQKSGSPNTLNYEQVHVYLEELNRKKFAGYSDWRLPTVRELMTLITQDKQSNGLYINPLFDSEQIWCWSSSVYARNNNSIWRVGFEDGDLYMGVKSNSYYVRAMRE